MAGERNPPSWLQAGTHPAEHDRLLVQGLLTSEGIVSTGDLAVSAKSPAAMSVNVAAGAAYVKGDEATYQGYYHVVSDATVSVNIGAADSTNPRIDLVVARVRDQNYSGSTNAWAVEVVAGTAAASPAVPALPANALKLAEVRVDAGVTTIVSGKITDRRVPSALRTGVVQSDRYPTGTLGMVTYRDSNAATEGLEVYNGTSWRPPWNVAWGEVAYGSVTADSGTLSTNPASPTALITVSNFTAVANRLYAIDCFASFQSGAANDGVQMQLRQTSATGTTLQQGFHVMPVSVYRGSIHMTFRGTFSAGSTTLVLAANRYVGTGNALLKADGGTPAYLLVRDVGPSGVPT